jgi:hypothetical protein
MIETRIILSILTPPKLQRFPAGDAGSVAGDNGEYTFPLVTLHTWKQARKEWKSRNLRRRLVANSLA